MSLTARFAGHFDRGILQRGGDYFRNGRVRIDSASASRIVAGVRGSSRYRVELEREGRKIRASCTCPYYDVDLCKHIWAVMLAAEGQPLLQGKDLELVHSGDEDDDLGGEFGEFDEDDEDSEEASRYLPTVPVHARTPVPTAPARPPSKPKAPSWRKQMAGLHPKAPAVHSYSPPSEPWPPARELLYVIDVPNARGAGVLYLDVLWRDPKKGGGWTKPKPRYLRREWLEQIPNVDDRHILAILAGATPVHGETYYSYQPPIAYAPTLPYRYGLTDPQPRLIVPMLCQTGRCHLRLQAQGEDEREGPPVTWEDGEPWQFRLEVRRSPEGEQYEMAGVLWRGKERLDLSEPLLLLNAGILFTQQARAAHYEHHGAFNWIALLREQGPLRVPAAQSEEFMAELLRQPRLPPLDLPEELRYEEVVLAPCPRLTVKPDKNGSRADQLRGELSFDYDGIVMAYGQPERGTVQRAERRLLLRDSAAESAAEQRLQALGWRWKASRYTQHEPSLELAARHLPAVVLDLTAAGWHVEAEGKVYRSAGRFEIQVSSGVDWFELHGAVEFGGMAAPLPELLAAMRRGENMVRLGDGSFGLLPQEWLQQYGLLAGLGEVHGDHLRFTRSQAGLLDALLAARPQASCDALFAQVRDELRSFTGIRALEAPAGFKGELRPYQKDGLGWFDFLRRFGFGGCLADDMGLGKTVQVLALLEARRELRERCAGKEMPPSGREPRYAAPLPATPPSRVRPSLAVVPKSLIFNWKQEAARFAPRLRVLDHTGTLRLKGFGHFEDYDLVLTTYGTLRNDAADFKDVRFDYLVLDEAQAIKNANSAAAKSVRLLEADHRLALSGTPIENHLGELWSLFEFLNPGMLGAASVFKMSHGAARNPGEDTRKLLARALRPFILRRTKEQVAPELPPKLEQTLYCELDTRQRRLYDQLRDHYRSTLLKRVQTGGIGQAKIQILEALLRLRQAAIHPGLLDKGRVAETSAKLDVLLPQLLQVLDEGHKTLVFSQFTGMLAILRQHLDREGILYEYLDGKTRDRQACVERFQTNPDCKLFLISLKAGGVGLNLTAAQYVFLLDPWWNPAVEAQAIDRAHRIGQANRVFAYRLIARGTVEEKVLELQNTKRDLADAIVEANEGMMRNLESEDLELLLS